MDSKDTKETSPISRGRDIDRFRLVFSNRWLKHNYNQLLNPDLDTFRFSPEFLEREKIVYRQTADRLIATIDDSGLLVDKTLHVVVVKQEWKSKFEICYLLGLSTQNFLLTSTGKWPKKKGGHLLRKNIPGSGTSTARRIRHRSGSDIETRAEVFGNSGWTLRACFKNPSFLLYRYCTRKPSTINELDANASNSLSDGPHR